MKLNKTCKVCGTRYAYCDGCLEYAHLEPWHNLFHDENCRKIFHIVTDFQAGLLTKASAQVLLEECDLSQKHAITASILEVVNTILVESAPENIAEPVAEIVAREPRKRNRKRNRLSVVETENIE